MNICCGGVLEPEKQEFEKIEVEVENGHLVFDNEKGVFTYKNTQQIKEEKNEKENLKKELEELDKEKENYEEKIKELDLKIKNLEKILLMDMKENQYIQIIGEKTEEKRRKDS